jgi:hypothetical protein
VFFAIIQKTRASIAYHHIKINPSGRLKFQQLVKWSFKIAFYLEQIQGTIRMLTENS